MTNRGEALPVATDALCGITPDVSTDSVNQILIKSIISDDDSEHAAVLTDVGNISLCFSSSSSSSSSRYEESPPEEEGSKEDSSESEKKDQ